MVGTGYVGLVSGACFADFGHDVVCVDKDSKKVDALKRGEIPIFEPGLDDIVRNNCLEGRLSFATSLSGAANGASGAMTGGSAARVASNGNVSTTSWSPRPWLNPTAAATRSRITLSFWGEGGATTRFAPSQRSS